MHSPPGAPDHTDVTPYAGSMTAADAFALREEVRHGHVSARELVSAALERGAEFASLGAFVSLEPELALSEAAAIDAKIAATPRDERRHLPPLTGLPTAHKDLVDQRGHITTHGSAALPHTVARADAPVARVVRAAGAISIGKTQVPEFGIAGYSENEVAAPARNPFDPTLTAGGSSGGTAGAIAAGVIPAAIGSDAGGSIRIPSAACGLIGLKPGRGVVPFDTAGATERARLVDEHGAPRMGVSGPLARTARDAAMLYDAILAQHQEPALAAVLRADELRGLRIGVSLASPFESWIPIRFSTEAVAALEAAVAALEARGHAVEEARIDYDPRYPEIFTTVWTSALARLTFSDDAEERLGALATMFLDRARRTPPDDLRTAAAALRRFAGDAGRQWSRYDAVLTPALAGTPPKVGAFRELGPAGDYRLQCEWAPQTSMVNVAGLPAIVVPAHRTADGLPMGVQLIGRAGTELRLLQLAEQLTQT